MNLTVNLSPVRSDQETTASVKSTVLTVNGTDYDLSELPDGAVAQHPDLGKVTRNGDAYECTIKLGNGKNAPHEARFPQPIVLNNHSGGIELPVYDIVEEEAADDMA